MPALTYKYIENVLGRFVKSSNSFRDVMNMVMPQIYTMGFWRDTIFETCIEVSDGIVTLPVNGDSILAIDVAGTAYEPHSRWSDYEVSSPNQIEGIESTLRVVDEGFSAVSRELPRDYGHQLIVRPFRGVQLPNHGAVEITFLDIHGIKHVQRLPLDGSSELLTDSYEVAIIISIVYEDVPEVVEVWAHRDQIPTEGVENIKAEDLLGLSEGRGNSVSRYRRYRIPTDSNNKTQKVALLLRRAFVPFVDDSDIEYLGNLAAIKHGLLATLAENNADYQRATQHWSMCEKILEDEINANRGAIKPKVKTRAVGGVRGSTMNMM